MRLIALFLLLTGWILVLFAVGLLHSAVSENLFVLAGLAVEVLGLAVLFRAHLGIGEEQP